jgi:hypothetical protein
MLLEHVPTSKKRYEEAPDEEIPQKAWKSIPKHFAKNNYLLCNLLWFCQNIVAIYHVHTVGVAP